MPEKNRWRIRRTVLVIACMCVVCIAAIWMYQINLSNDKELHVATALKKAAAKECSNFGAMVERAFRILEAAAALNLDTATDTDFERLEEAMQYCLRLSAPADIWLKNAASYKPDSEPFLSFEEMARVFSGERVISGPILKNNAEYFSIAVPVLRDGSVVAALGCTAEAALLSDLMLSDSVLPDGYRMFIDADRGVISLSEKERDWWKEHGLLENTYTAASLNGLRSIETEEATSAEGSAYALVKGAEIYYLTEVSLGINNWTLRSAVSQPIVLQEYGFSGENQVILHIVLLMCFLLALAFLYSIWGKERRVIREERNRLAWLEERYRIVARESDDVIFEISLPDMLIEANENFHKLLGYNVVQWNSEYLSRVHPEDEQKFAAIYEGIRAGKRLMKEELRFRRADGTYLWCRLLIAILVDSQGKPARALGKITNIDSQKREAAWLRQKAQQDALTNLYNKETTHRMIRQFLETEGAGGVHGLMVLDVDNFKEINDTRGHLYGDAVLAAVADKLRMQFRSTDIVGRIGGDEFLVFLKNVNSRTQLDSQAAALMQAFTVSGPDKELGYQIRCSIGAAAYPEDGVGEDQLFQNADSALYRAKRQGKGRYAMFRRDLDQPGPSRPSPLGGEAQDMF